MTSSTIHGLRLFWRMIVMASVVWWFLPILNVTALTDFSSSSNNSDLSIMDVPPRSRQSPPPTSQFLCTNCGTIVNGTGCCTSCNDNFGTMTLSTKMGSVCSTCSIISNYPNTYTCTQCTSSTSCGVPPPDSTSVKVCRYSQEGTGDHWYSTNCNANGGTNYVAEKPLGYAIAGPVNNMLPLYEFLSNDGTRQHFYTTNPVEGQNFVTGKNYSFNGFVCSIYPRFIPGFNYPVYRFSNSDYTPYLLTIDPGDVGTGPYWKKDYTVGYMPIAT